MAITTLPPTIVYPESDGQPMADNTLQFHWIVTLEGNLERLFAASADVFVAGDLLWYPVEGEPKVRQAPDVLVAFGRPKGHRGSYLQWREGGIPPQVVFEVLSPGNRFAEMTRKLAFYERHGVEEYYVIDPDAEDAVGWARRGGGLQPLETLDGWVSPRLGIRFEVGADGVRVLYPDGRAFERFVDAIGRADSAEQRADSAEQREARLRELLRAHGIDPETSSVPGP